MQALEIQIADRRLMIRVPGAASGAEPVRELPAASLSLEPADLARIILAEVRALDVSGARSTLIIPSSWTYVHRFSTPQKRPSREMLTYALEEFLPLEVERLTCEFLAARRGETIGVALETDRMRALLDALEQAGIFVDRITPDVLCAAPHTDESNGRTIWCDDEHAAELAWHDGRIAELRVVRLAADLPADEWVARLNDFFAADGEAQTSVQWVGSAAPDRVKRLAEQLTHAPNGDGTTRVTRSTTIHHFNLARDSLAPASRRDDFLRALRRTTATLLAALLVVCGALSWYQDRVNGRLLAVAEWERSEFVRLFPDQPVPTGVALRFSSERRRLEGLTLTGGNQVIERTDALETLRIVVAALPADLRLDLQEIRIEGRDVIVRGRTRDHRQAERLAAALGATAALEADPPRTDRHRDGGVQFYLHARRTEDELPREQRRG